MTETEKKAEAATKPVVENMWSPFAKVAVGLLCVAVYLYLVLVVKVLYSRQQSLDRIMHTTAETQQMIHKLHLVDHGLAVKVQQLQAYNLEY